MRTAYECDVVFSQTVRADPAFVPYSDRDSDVLQQLLQHKILEFAIPESDPDPY
jgi:hypothetical protein